MSKRSSVPNVFYDAIDLIDGVDKRAYEEALQKCPPHLLETECHPRDFLDGVGGDPWKAARRLIDYWNGRVALFGADRAYSPLLSDADIGTSALDEDDLAVVRSGHVQVAEEDGQGRTVLLVDHSLLEGDDMRQLSRARLRTFFYVISKAVAQSNSPSAHELVLIVQAVRPSRSSYDWNCVRDLMRFNDWMPAQFTAVHILASEPALPGATWLWKAAMPALSSWFVDKHLIPQLHFGASAATPFFPQTLLLEMQALGLGPRCLPQCVGGGFSLEDFRGWLRRQQRRELFAYLSPEERLHRKREKNRLHSVEKRQRRKYEWHALESECQRLRQANSETQQANQVLEHCLQQARVKLQQFGVDVPAVPEQNRLSKPAASSSLMAGEFMPRPCSTSPTEDAPTASQTLYRMISDLLCLTRQAPPPALALAVPTLPVARRRARSTLPDSESESETDDALRRLVQSVATTANPNDGDDEWWVEPTPLEQVFAKPPTKLARY